MSEEKSVVSFTALKPVLIVDALKVDEAVHFYKSAFDAVEVERPLYPKSNYRLPQVISAELELAGTTIIIRDVSAFPGPTGKPKAVTFGLETDDGGAAVAKAVSAGAVRVGEAETTQEGVVIQKLTDPFGYTWIFTSPANIEIENAQMNDDDDNQDQQEELLMEEDFIDHQRNILIEHLDHFRDYSTTLIGHAIDSFEYRGPDVSCSIALNRMLDSLDFIVSRMRHWIDSLIEAADDEDEDDDAFHSASDDEDEHAFWGAHFGVVAADISRLYQSRIQRCQDAYDSGRIEYRAFFNRRISIAKKMLTLMQNYGATLHTICPSLDTLEEFNNLKILIEVCLVDVKIIDIDQQRFEREDIIAGRV